MIRVPRYDTEQRNQLCCSCIVRISNFLTLHITSAQPKSCFTVCHFQNPTMVPISVSVKISCKRNQYSIFQANSSKENERKYQKSAHFFQSLKYQFQSPWTKAILYVSYQDLKFTFTMETQELNKLPPFSTLYVMLFKTSFPGEKQLIGLAQVMQIMTGEMCRVGFHSDSASYQFCDLGLDILIL